MKITLKTKEPLPYAAETIKTHHFEIDKKVIGGKTYTSKIKIEECENICDSKEMFRFYGVEFLDKMLQIENVEAHNGSRIIVITANNGIEITLDCFSTGSGFISFYYQPKTQKLWNPDGIFVRFKGDFLTKKNIGNILKIIKEEQQNDH